MRANNVFFFGESSIQYACAQQRECIAAHCHGQFLFSAACDFIIVVIAEYIHSLCSLTRTFVNRPPPLKGCGDGYGQALATGAWIRRVIYLLSPL